MTAGKPSIRVIIITQDSEMKLASDVLLLKYYLEKEARIKPDIVIVDNGSRDRTVDIVHDLKLELYKSRSRKIKKEIVNKVMMIGAEKEINTLIILDLQGGNTADDAISLIARSVKEGARFASAYISPPKEKAGIGCWAIDKGIFRQMGRGSEMDIQKRIIELATKEDLELWAISEEISLQKKKNRKKVFELFKGSPANSFMGLVRYHPLTIYGLLGLLILSVASITGFYTVDYFYRNNDINFFPAFLTAGLVMLGGFFMVAGLILNIMNILVERLEAMSRWNE